MRFLVWDPVNEPRLGGIWYEEKCAVEAALSYAREDYEGDYALGRELFVEHEGVLDMVLVELVHSGVHELILDARLVTEKLV